MSSVEMAAAAFSTADAVTAPPAFDAGGPFNADFLGMAFHDDDDDDDNNAAWGLSPLSPSLPSWNAKTDPSFPVSLSLDPEFKHTAAATTTAQMNNGQPTPPLDEKPTLISAADLNMASYPAAESNTNRGNPNPAPAPAWNDAPTPPNADISHRRKSSGGGSSSARGGGTDHRGSVTKRRRSAREHKPTTHHRMASSSGADSDDPDPEQLKRERFLERNRLAASKCRQKKKEHTMQLESKFKEQSDKRDELNAEISALRGQILALKNEVLKHAQCGDEPIKLHLAQMVKQITYRDSQDPQPHGLPDCSVTAAAAAAAAAAASAPGPPLSATASASVSASGSAVADAQSSTPSSSSPVHGGISFGFDDQLHLDSSTSFEQQIRRDSEASMAFSADDDFDNLINV